MRAYLKTKTGEVEGEISFIKAGDSGRVFAMFDAFDLSLSGRTRDSEINALADFETNFGRIIREDG